MRAKSSIYLLAALFVAFNRLEDENSLTANLSFLASVQGHKTIADDEDEIQGGAGAGDAIIDDMGEEVEENGQIDDVDMQDFKVPPEPKTFGTLKQKLIGFFQHEPEYYWIHYKLEFGALTIFLIVFYFFVDGKNTNAQLAITWCNNVVKMIRNDFEHIGCTQSTNYAVMQRSYSEFDYFASGRKNLLYADFKLYLIRRHCIITKYLFDGFKGHEDYLEMSIPIDLGNRQLPLELFICKKKDVKQKLQELAYLKEYVKNANSKNYRIPDAEKNKNTLMILTEHDEIANNLIDSNIGQDLVRYTESGMLHELHVTDMQTYNNHPLFLRAQIMIPGDKTDTKAFETHVNIISTILQLVDNISSLKMSDTVKSKCDKARKAIRAAAKEKKEAELTDKKADALKEEKLIEKERIKKMTPAEQAKYEEKQRKKEMKKQKGKLMKVTKA